MTYNKVRQPKLSDVIEQQIELLILQGKLRVGDKLPPERELAIKFEVSRPSVREAIQRLEVKGLLRKRQGGGTYVRSNLWPSFSDPLPELLASSAQSQFDLLEARHAFEGIAAYYAALRGNDEDFEQIKQCYSLIEDNPLVNDANSKADAVMRYQTAITFAAHNVVLLHLHQTLIPLLQSSIRQNFERLYARKEALKKVGSHRAAICAAILARSPEKAREASYLHLDFIKEVLLELNREQSRQEGNPRQIQLKRDIQQKD